MLRSKYDLDIEAVNLNRNDPKYQKLTSEQLEQYIPHVTELISRLQSPQKYISLCRELQKKYQQVIPKVRTMEVYHHLLKLNQISRNKIFEDVGRLKRMKSQSGITSVTVVMGPSQFSCPEKCSYCPDDPKIAKSYLLREPAVLRGAQYEWDAFDQFTGRCQNLFAMGHKVTKIELNIKGGTFSYYPKEYSEEFIRDCFSAANQFWGLVKNAPLEIKILFDKSKVRHLSLPDEQKINTYAKCCIIGLTIETRPDWITKVELKRLRYLGVTRIEIGIQHLDDEILDVSDRKCPTYKTKNAIRLAKNNGFKIDGHFMLGMPYATYQDDMQMLQYLFSTQNTDIQVDQMKFYPTMVTDYTQIKEWYEKGIYVPWHHTHPELLHEILGWVCEKVPKYIRINRVMRDIPNGYVHAGHNQLSLRSTLKTQNDIRGREVKDRTCDVAKSKIFIHPYQTNGGREFFISYENLNQTQIYGFCRLRLPNAENARDAICQNLKQCALIRELHVYGEVQYPGEKSNKVQHLKIGQLLLHVAEKIAFQNEYKKISVISGVGVRRYYSKFGYQLSECDYMMKVLNQNTITSYPKRVNLFLVFEIFLFVVFLVLMFIIH